MHSQFESSEQSVFPVRVERYLRDISAPLPAQEQAEWRSEAYQHLDSLIAAHQELGLSHEEAIDAALHSFGEARKIGVGVARESKGGIKKEILRGVVHFAMPLYPFILFALAAVLGYTYSGEEEAYLSGMAALATTLLIACPIIGGWNVGRRTLGDLPVRDLFLVPLLASLLCSPDVLLFCGMRNHLLFASPGRDIVWASSWLPLSIGSAFLSRLCCRRGKRGAIAASGAAKQPKSLFGESLKSP